MTALNKKSIKDIDVKGKKVIARCDFNVPFADGAISDEKRIVESLPTIKYLKEQGAKIILCSHLGRPKGEFNPKYSLAPVAAKLAELLGCEVKMSKDVIGPDTEKLSAELKAGEIMLIENVRFHKEEEANDPAFAKKLASFAEIFVNDAFGTAHRAHASTAGLADYLPAVCGFLIQKEIEIMGNALANPKRPFVAILGGAKVSDKIGVIENLLDKVDTLIVGGGMAYTFMKAQGYQVGTSLCENDKLDLARTLLADARKKEVSLLLPLDNVVGDKFAEDCDAKEVDFDLFPADYMGLDIGVHTRKVFTEAIKDAGTVIWNGPMGVFEWERFAAGTKAVAIDRKSTRLNSSH